MSTGFFISLILAQRNDRNHVAKQDHLPIPEEAHCVIELSHILAVLYSLTSLYHVARIPITVKQKKLLVQIKNIWKIQEAR